MSRVVAGVLLTLLASFPVAGVERAKRRTERSKEPKHSVAPFAGYTPTYKFFLGGGYFFESERFDVDVEAVLTFVKAYQLQTEVTWRATDVLTALGRFEVKKGFDPFYGMGSDTRAFERVDIFGDQFLVVPKVEYAIDEHWSVGLVSDTRIRVEDHVKDRPGTRLFPNETTSSFGAYGSVDYRDREQSPRNGFVAELEMRYTPGFLSSIPGKEAFAQIEASFSWFTEVVPRFIVAANLQGGATLGQPTYMFQYNLGGADRLIGFHENRFRGKFYYLQQTELRFPIWRIFQGGLFLNVGDISDSELHSPRVSYGVGLRIGLPPDYVERARIDIGFTADQTGLFIDFGYPF